MMYTIAQLLKFFSVNNSNLLLMYPLDYAHEYVDVSKTQILEHIPVQFNAQGNYHCCVCTFQISNDHVELFIDGDFDLIINLPLLDYDIDIIKEQYVDAISNSIMESLPLYFIMTKVELYSFQIPSSSTNIHSPTIDSTISDDLTKGERMVTKVHKWESTSGKLFDHQKDALRDDEIHEALQFFDNNPIYGKFEGCKVYGDDITEYLDDNRDMIFQYYGVK